MNGDNRMGSLYSIVVNGKEDYFRRDDIGIGIFIQKYIKVMKHQDELDIKIIKDSA